MDVYVAWFVFVFARRTPEKPEKFIATTYGAYVSMKMKWEFDDWLPHWLTLEANFYVAEVVLIYYTIFAHT